MENKNPKNEKQKRSKAAKIVLWSILGCIGVMVVVILVYLIVGMVGGTGTQNGSILGLEFGTLFTILGFLVLALILAWLLTEPSFKKEEEVVVVDDRYASYVKKAKTPRPIADKTGAKAPEKNDKSADEAEKPTEQDEKPSDEAETPAEQDEKPSDEAETPAEQDEKPSDETETPTEQDEKPSDEVEKPSDEAEKPSEDAETPVENDAKDKAESAAADVAGAEVAGVVAAGAAETVFVRYRRSYMSRLIQADEDIKAYYTDIKNKLLSYKGVHDRVSWDFESFNAGRKKLAKINIKGKTITVNLALDPKTVEAKYYASDVSGKAKLSDVPTLMKVKSGRSVKYTLELIEKMMTNEGIPANAVPSKETFDIAYRDTDALVKEGYIKAMYDKDVDPNGNYIEKEVDIKDFISK